MAKYSNFSNQYFSAAHNRQNFALAFKPSLWVYNAKWSKFIIFVPL